MVDNDMPGAWPVWTPGAPLAAFIKERIIHWSTQHIEALGHMVSEKRIFYVFPLTPRGGARMDHRGTVGRIYKEDHYTLLKTKYESFGPCGFREEFFLSFSHDAPGLGPVWTPGARLAGFIKRTSLLLTKYESSGPCGFGEEDFFLCFSHCKSMGANDPPRAGPFLTPGA